MTQPSSAPTRRESGGGLSYVLAALGILTSLSLGVATLIVGVPPVDPEEQGPSVSLEEIDPNQGGDAPKDAQTPGYDPKQAGLAAAEDDRLYATVAQTEPGTPPHDVQVGNQPPTVVLPARPTPYDLNTLISSGAVVRQPDGALLMQKSVLVGSGAQLRLTAPNTTLRMSSGPRGFTTLMVFKGSMVLEGNEQGPLTITSWDPTKNAPDTEVSDGRSYIRAVGARMDLRSVNTTDLGFWSGRTGGVAWTGTASEAATGSARAVSFVRNHYGLFSDRTKGLLINGAEIKNSAMDGVAVNRDSEGTELWRVVSAQSARNGIMVARGARNISMREVTATGNQRNGIYLNGKPSLTPTPGAATPSTPPSGYVVEGSTIQGNNEHGILIVEADKTELSNNTIAGNRDGVIVRGDTQDLTVRENEISSAGGFAVAIRDGAPNAVVEKNKIVDALTAVQVNDAVAKISGNEIDRMSLHAVSIIGNGHGSAVVNNRLTGRGPSAIDLNRLMPEAVVEISGNDDTNWIVDRDDLQYLASYVRGHPLILLWALILVFPLAARIYFRHRRSRQTIGEHPYKQVPPLSSIGSSATTAVRVPNSPATTGRPMPVTNVPRPGPTVRPDVSAVQFQRNGTGPETRNGAKPAEGKQAGQKQRPPSSGGSASRQPGQPGKAGRPSTQPPKNSPQGNRQQSNGQQPTQPTPPGKPGEKPASDQRPQPNGAPRQGPNKRPPQGGGGTRVTVVSPQ